MEDLEGRVDFAAAIHLYTTRFRTRAFFSRRSAGSLKPGGRLLAIEPKGHVKPKDFQNTLEAAQKAGFRLDTQGSEPGGQGGVVPQPMSRRPGPGLGQRAGAGYISLRRWWIW